MHNMPKIQRRPETSPQGELSNVIFEKIGGEMARNHIMRLTPQQNSHLDWDKREFGVAIQSAQQASTVPNATPEAVNE